MALEIPNFNRFSLCENHPISPCACILKGKHLVYAKLLPSVFPMPIFLLLRIECMPFTYHSPNNPKRWSSLNPVVARVVPGVLEEKKCSKKREIPNFSRFYHAKPRGLSSSRSPLLLGCSLRSPNCSCAFHSSAGGRCCTALPRGNLTQSSSGNGDHRGPQIFFLFSNHPFLGFPIVTPK